LSFLDSDCSFPPPFQLKKCSPKLETNKRRRYVKFSFYVCFIITVSVNRID
jgi:hypothetical protein